MIDALIRTPWLAAEDAAKYVHVRTSRMREMMSSGEIPTHKVGRGRYAHTADLDLWVRAQPSGADNPLPRACMGVE